MMINSDPYAERTVCSCLISNPYMSNWNAAQGSCIYFFFFYFYSLKHFLCLYSGPLHGFGGDQYITLPESQKLLPLISTVGTDWWGSIVSPHLYLILLQIVFHAGEGELVSFSTTKKKITGQIAYVGGRKHPQHKACFLACSPSLWKSDAHLQIGKICSL